MGRHITKMFGRKGECASRLLMRGKKKKSVRDNKKNWRNIEE